VGFQRAAEREGSVSGMLLGEGPGSVFDKDYWLSHCQGFQARTPERRLGVIREVRFLSRLDRPDELVVCGGLFGHREEIVPVDEVTEVVPSEERIYLRLAPEATVRRPPRLRLRRV
jgi:hypothetical protein